MTAFSIPGRGLYQFTRLPFGLHNAPATFQRLVDKIFGPELEPFVFVYLDDIVIATPTFGKHLEILSEVFERLQKANLTLSRKKCSFCRTELKYLGYVVSRQGLHVDPEKVSAIVNIPIPQSVQEIRRIIGMSSWYRRFIPNYSTRIAPLTNLIRKNVKFNWSIECDEALHTIKDALISAPILTCPDMNKPFVLQTDASGYGIGAVLTQTQDGCEKVICYVSRSLTAGERKFSTTERECLAVLWSVERLRCYLEGRKFTVITDHFSLVWLNNLKNPQGRLGRWAVRLQQFDYEIQHRKGKDLVVPDTLSRSVPISCANLQVKKVNSDEIRDRWYKKMVHQVQEKPLLFPKWRVEQGVLYKHIESDFSNLKCENENWKKVVPKQERGEIIRECHDAMTSGHLGIYKTFNRIARLYYWPSMKADITRYVKNCLTCQRTKPEQKTAAGHMTKRPIFHRPWQAICTDLVGPLPKSTHGNLFILVVSDLFSKFTLFFPIRRATANAVTKIIEEKIFLLFGVPQYVLCDNGVQYKSKEFTKMLERYGTRPIYNPNYHPQSNPAERVNRVLKTMLAAYVKENHRKWDEYLPYLGCAIRTARHEVTTQTPYFVNFGQDMCLHGKEYKEVDTDETQKTVIENKPENITKMRQFVKKRLEEAAKKVREKYNLRNRYIEFNVGDLVWKRNYSLSDGVHYINAKLAGKFTGPYRIKRRVGYCIYELIDDLDNSKGNWHTKDLKPHYEDPED